MRLTLAEELFLKGLMILRERYGVSAVKVLPDRDEAVEVVWLEWEGAGCDVPEEVQTLREGVKVSVIEPLLHRGYIAMSPHQTCPHLWITPDGADAVEGKQPPGFATESARRR